MSDVTELVAELQRSPNRFEATGGYERLLQALWGGSDVDALVNALRTPSDLSGDLLRIVVELQDLRPFVEVALLHIHSTDKASAAYSMETVLRGSDRAESLKVAFEALNRSCDAVCEQAARTLVGLGEEQVWAVLDLVKLNWAQLLQRGSMKAVPFLLKAEQRDRQVVGAVLNVLAWEMGQGQLFVDGLGEGWLADYFSWLKRCKR